MKEELLKQSEVVDCINNHLSEATNKVLQLMDTIPSLSDELLDKLEEQLTNEWNDSPIFEHARDFIMATVNSYRQDRILKELDEKFRQLQAIESDYNILDKDCRILFDKLTRKSFEALNTREYRCRFIDEIYDYYIEMRDE